MTRYGVIHGRLAIAGVLAAGASLLVACSTTPPMQPVVAPGTVSPEAIVARIRAAAGHDDAELAVQPLRDPMVEDLRQMAMTLEAQRRYAEAAANLDRALMLSPGDPALLQERAEAALLQENPALAEALARRAYAAGSRVGPLCRRHWATVRQARLLAGDAAGASSAQAQVQACRVAGPNRF